MIGTTISHYKILEKIGEGGMGVVYKAHDNTLDRIVALKFLPHYLTSDPTEKERFYHEAKAASALNHTNITTIHEIAEYDGQLFIAMELVEGKTLKQLVEHEILPITKILDIAIQVCDGLQAAHDKGIVHRDIKSENIMLTPKGQVKIMDFGLAKVKGATKLTKEGSTLGTAAYMSPEQAQGEEVDYQSDLFSFGVVLYELLTGKLPFRGEHHAALMYSIINEEPPPVARFNEKVTPEIEHIVSKALAKDREERYQHSDDLLADLRHERKKLEYAKAGYVTKSSGFVPRTKKRHLFKIAIGLVAVLLLAVLALLLRPFRQESNRQNLAPSKEKSIAVMYFENRSNEKDLDKLLVDMLITNLGRNAGISVMSGQRLYDILKNLDKEGLAVIDKSTATAVAKEAGVKTMLLGSIWRVGEKFSVAAQLLDVASGEVINSNRIETPAKPENIFEIADSLTARVNGWLKVAQAGPLHITDATTGSVDAYRHYEIGVRFFNRLEFDSAEVHLQRAVRLDSTFAMAYLRLSQVQGTFQVNSIVPSQDLVDARKTLEKAKQYAENLPVKDKKIIAAWSAGLARDRRRADSLIADLVLAHTEEKEFFLWLGLSKNKSGKYQEAIQLYQRAIELDRSYDIGYNMLAYTYCLLGEYEKAFSMIDTYVALLPDAWNPYDTGCEVYEMAGRPTDALKILEEGHRRKPSESTYFWRRYAIFLGMGDFQKADEAARFYAESSELSPEVLHRYLSLSCLMQGNVHEAIRLLMDDLPRLRKESGKANEISHRFLLGRIFMEQKKYDDALNEFKMVQLMSEEIYRGPFNPWNFVVEYFNGLCHLGSGNILHAETDAAALLSRIQYEQETFYLFLYNGLRADIELSKGNAEEALSFMSQNNIGQASAFPRTRILQARIYAARKDKENAVAFYDQSYNHILSRSANEGGDFYDFYLERSKLDYYKARMYEESGEKELAIQFYEKAIHNWRNADRDYVHLGDAKASFARLKGDRL